MKAAILAILLTAANGASAELACTKIGFQPGTPDPNYCVTINGGESPEPDTLAQAKRHAERYADRGDARTLVQANAHADAGDARTLESAKSYTAERFAALDRLTSAGIAQAAAIASPVSPSDGRSALNVGVASFAGKSAVGVTFAHQWGRVNLNAGVSKASGGRTLSRVGFGWSF